MVRAPNWIGDAIISLPALKELRRLSPGARLSVLAKPWVADIYHAGGLADEVILFDRSLFPGLAGIARLARHLRAHSFSCALLLQNAFEAAVIARLAAIPVRVGYNTGYRGFLLTCAVPLPRHAGAIHQSFYYLNLLTAAGFSPMTYSPESGYQPDASLQLSEEQRLPAARLLQSLGISAARPLVGINPGAAYGPAKRWFPERYAAVADHLASRWSAQVLVFGSAGELEIAWQIERAMRQRPIVLAGRTTLLELMGLIQHCDLFVTNDSGPMHLAAALRRPLIALFGSTDERLTGPMSCSAHVIHKPVECTPCFRRTCPIDLRCFGQISVGEVCELADRIFQSQALSGSPSENWRQPGS
ncbi:MAG: lipopolysaccharide heptosyltransferase II [Acidobacteria bacterium]|nr:lipopolysaccharide heptosyltransferase II [Acidobacteriota bacterium]